MKSLVLLLIVIVAPLGLLAEVVSDILPAQKRAETLVLARTLLTLKPTESSEEDLAAKNPFNPIQLLSQGVEVGQNTIQAPALVSDRELLKTLADSVMPSGMMQLGDKTILLVGRKKLKVGDRISVNSEGTPYELEVSAIDRTSFSLRLKNEEITRPIKAPAKK
jgi:hypothetical protein